MEHVDNGAEVVADIIDGLPAKAGYVIVGFGCFAVRFGPYPPEQIGEFLERLMAAHKGPHPFLFTLDCGWVEDPVPLLLDLVKPDDEAATVDADSPAA